MKRRCAARGLVAVLVAVVAAAGVTLRRPVYLGSEARPPGLRADVLVVGGSPGGVAAAVRAARQGMVVVLTEPRPFLGTVWTAAMLNMVDVNRLPGNGQPLTRGFFEEIVPLLGGTAFDPRRARNVLRDKVEAEPGITLLLETTVLRPLVEDDAVIGAILRLPDGAEMPVLATVTIDATDDGDFAAAAGVPFTIGREASGIDRRTMPATLIFRVSGLDWPRLARHAYKHRRGRQPSGAHNGYVWGFRNYMWDYRPADETLSAHDLNIGRLPDGSGLVNSLQVHDVDGLDAAARFDGYRRARDEVPRLVEYLRARVPGFERARLVEIAPELYIRETRHLAGLYTLTAADIAARTLFWDRVAAASYPVDLHQYRPGERYPYRPVRVPYTIPLRSLVAARVDRLFLASRAFSATYQAAGSARIVPTTMAMGEAAAVAAAVAVEAQLTPHALVERPDLVRDVQRRLVAAGAVIEF